jgi:hypothetical protein
MNRDTILKNYINHFFHFHYALLHYTLHYFNMFVMQNYIIRSTNIIVYLKKACLILILKKEKRHSMRSWISQIHMK